MSEPIPMYSEREVRAAVCWWVDPLTVDKVIDRLKENRVLNEIERNERPHSCNTPTGPTCWCENG